MDLALDDVCSGPKQGTRPVLNFFAAPPMIFNAKSVFLEVNASLGWLNNVSGLILSVPANII
jgi:hypothetical protein